MWGIWKQQVISRRRIGSRKKLGYFLQVYVLVGLFHPSDPFILGHLERL